MSRGLVEKEAMSLSPASRHFRSYLRAGLLLAVVSLHVAAALAGSLRIVTYNIEADIDGYTTARPGLTTVIQGIGNEVVSGGAQPFDVLALQETTSNNTTVAPIVSDLNVIYGAGAYAMSTYQATQSGGAGSGNGPNAMIYHAGTLQLIASVGIGTPSSSGYPRQPVRYQFRPVGGTAALDFYVYVSHTKSGTDSTSRNRRNIEAQALRTNAATLPASARVIYTGDFNWDSSSEPCYVTLTATTPSPGQGFDPLNRPGDWALNSAFRDILTESATNLRYRDDCQLVTQNILSDPNGLLYVAGSYHTFGVNGTTPVNGNVNSPSNTALAGLPNRAAVLAALTTASDHLPVVADYVLPSTSYTLTVSVTGSGSVALNPPGGSYAPGTTVQVTANAAGGWEFDHWTGDLSGSTNPTNVLMNGNKSVGAVFVLTQPLCPGDSNCDGVVSFGDIDTFVEALQGESNWTHADCPWLNADTNADGGVTYADIDGFVARIGNTCP
jgi:endonuclease/exonuclease/phosphatase family metal-dependent hydrolase